MESLLIPSFLRTASKDVLLLFIARGVRMLSYGSLTVILLLYLRSIGFTDLQVGLLLTCILCGDLGITFQLTTSADHVGRKRTLIIGALLKVFAGLLFCYSTNFFILAIAGIIGVISSTGGEIGPFMAIEQSALMDVFTVTTMTNSNNNNDSVSSSSTSSASASSTSSSPTSTTIGIATLFGWYNAVGYFCQALGALVAGYTITILEVSFDYFPINAYRIILGFYALLGLVKAILYSRLSPLVEAPLYRNSHSSSTGGGYARTSSSSLSSSPVPTVLFSSSSSSSSSILPLASSSSSFVSFDPSLSFTERIYTLCTRFTDTGIRRNESKYIIQRLSILFFMDSFANGFVMQTFLVFWFAIRWGIEPVTLGTMISLANVLAGISGILAGRLVRHIGAIRTMVFTHLPSNILLGLVPLMPTSYLAIFILLLRFCVCQMDAPARQAYVTMVVSSDERSAASGVTNIARSIGLALSPLLLGIVIGGNDKEDLYILSPNIHKHPSDVPFNFNLPFYIAAIIKIIYDIILFYLFKERDTGMETNHTLSNNNNNSNNYGKDVTYRNSTKPGTHESSNGTSQLSSSISSSSLSSRSTAPLPYDMNSIMDDIIGYD